jgi:hypothetical protein
MRSTPPTPFLSIACLSSLCLVFYAVLGWTQIETRDSNCLERSVEQIRSPPGTTVSTSLSGIVEKTEGGMILSDKDMKMTFELTGKDFSQYVGMKIYAVGQLAFK